MKKLNIVYILPGVGISGGVAVALQHANRLKKRNYNVSILNIGVKKEIDWFKCDIPVFHWDIANNPECPVNDIDIAIATHFSTAKIVNNEITAKRKIYFVQSDERRFDLDMNTFIECQNSYKLDFEYMTEAVWIQRWLKDEFGHDAYYVPNGLDETIFFETEPITPKSSKVRILLEGPIDFLFKGMTDAYNAVKNLDCELWIISSYGKPKEDWKYDRFFENVSMNEMKGIYSSCDIFLKLSRVEGFFGPPLEAMTCGCSVVVGKCTGYDEYIVNKHNALVVEKGDVEGAKKAIQLLIDNLELRSKLIKNGHVTAQEWNWDRSTDLLEEAMQGKHPTIYYTNDKPEKYDYSQEIGKIAWNLLAEAEKRINALSLNQTAEHAQQNNNQALQEKERELQEIRQALHSIKTSLQWKIPNYFYRFYINKVQKFIPKPIFRTIDFFISLTRKKTVVKKDAALEIDPNTENISSPEETLRLFSKETQPKSIPIDIPIDIIIPVYNGYEYLDALFKSIFLNTNLPYRLLITDDCSSDSRVWPFLKKIKDENSNKSIELFRNEHNLGFIKTINNAVKLTRNNFLIINTDVEVPEFWLERMMFPIFNLENIASTTPFTNAGTICSFPEILKDNEIFEGLTVNQIDHYFRYVKKSQYFELPTGVGFCMGFNKNLVDKIGMFDETSFGKGYGEENDWCQRAIKVGYKNIIATDLFVYHKHGGSFDTQEKKKLLEKNLETLVKKHPGYSSMVENFVKNDPLKLIRDFLFILISTNNKNTSKTTLYFDHELGGGANIYTANFISTELQRNNKVLVVTYNFEKKNYKLSYHHKNRLIRYAFNEFSGLHDFLHYINLDKIIISELVSYNNPLRILGEIEKIQIEQKCELEILIHDFFSVCPNFNLVNKEGKYCDLPDAKDCNLCLKENRRTYFDLYTNNDSDIYKWRKAWESILNVATRIVVFSQSSKDILRKAYPAISTNKLFITPHKVEYLKPVLIPEKIKNKEIKIGALGDISFVKGCEIIREMVAIIEKESLPIKLIVIGEIRTDIKSSRLIVTGKYDKNELPELVMKNGIDLFFIPSIWPETFSYTTEEIIQMKMPIAVFNLGAPAERVANYDKGLIISKIDARFALDSIIKFHEKP